MSTPPLPIDPIQALNTINARLSFLEDHIQTIEAGKVVSTQAYWDWVKSYCSARGEPLPQKFDPNLK